MPGVIQQLRQRARWHVRRTLMGGIGVALVLTGGGFGVAALWLALAPQVGAVGAALILGSGFAGAGLIVLSLSGGAPPHPEEGRGSGGQAAPGGAPPKGLYRPRGDHPPLMEAFLLGLSVYLETRGKGR